MTPARIAVIVGALVVSIALAFVVHGLIGHPKPATAVIVSNAPAMTQVLVAKTDLGVGSILSADNLRWQDWPASGVDPTFITSGQTMAAAPGAPAALNQAKNVVTNMASGGGPKLQAMVGAIVREDIAEGEPITAHKIVRAGQSSYMAVRLPEGMRAMALPLTTESGAGGFIEPGDHVDIYSTHADTSKNGGGGMITETVITNVLVLAIDQHADVPKNTSTLPGSTITLEVPEASVTTVAKARGQTGLTIALRSYADIGGRPGGPAAGDGHAVRLFKGGGAPELVTAQ